MITKRSEHGMITVLPDGQVQLREDTVIEEDGVELSRQYHRQVLEPSRTIEKTTDDLRLSAILLAVWTPEVVEAYEKAKAERMANNPVLGGARAS